LSERDRRLLEAFLVRRRGANAEAELHYRSILGTNPDEMEAWLDLAEILFHANPLHGRSFVDSREALDKVLAFDPSHSTALIHLSRVAAYEGSQAELDSLADRFMFLNPEPERTLEIEALRAFSRGDESGIAATLARLESAEDLAVALAVWATTVYARNLKGAEQVARLLTDPHRSPEARRLGYAWLAHLALAAGKWTEAQARLAELAELSEGIALEYRALLSNIPFVRVSDEDLRAVVTDLERLEPALLPTSNNPRFVFTAHDSVHPLIRSYLLGLTEARLGNANLANRFADEAETAEVSRTAGSMPQDLARSIRSQILLRQGKDAEALVELEQLAMQTWYGQTMASPLYCQVYERFTRAELLHRLARHQEALAWYGSLVETSPFELPYLAVAHLRRAEIYDELDQPERAAEHYARFVEMWKDADPRFQPMVESASRRLEELEVTGS
jgi:tetratricopeptide (TPR) repeat protein